MSILTETIAVLTIASGQTTSGTLGSVLSRGQLRTALGFLDNMTIFLPQGISEDIQVQISPVRNPTASDWVTYGSIGVIVSDELLTEVGDVILAENSDPLLTETDTWGGTSQLDDLSFKDLRLMSTKAVAADRVFKILGKLVVPSGA